MYFANPWGLLGLAALPVIVGIHLYRRRFPAFTVAGLHLWAQESRIRDAGRRRERLPVTRSLVLELLAAVLMTLALSRPMFGGLDSVDHLVVILDSSASMSARPPSRSSFRDDAIVELERRAEQLKSSGVFTLLATGRRTEILAGPATTWENARRELSKWQPQHTKHDFQPAWDLAAQLTQHSGHILFLTDRLPPDEQTLPERMEVVSLGRPADNVALTDARWTFDSATNRGHVLLAVANLGARPADVRVDGTSGTQTLFQREITLPPGGRGSLQTDVPGGLGSLDVNLNWPADALAVDNTATLLEPKVRPVKVAVTLPDHHTALPAVRRALAGIPDIQFDSTESADLVVASADNLPPSRGGLWWLGVGPADPSEAARQNAKDLIGPYLVEKRNPLLDGVLLNGVIWGGVQPLDWDVIPLVSAGQSILLAQLKGTQTAAYLLNIDLARSNLAESPDWPILTDNLVRRCRSDLPGLTRWNFRINEDIRFRNTADDEVPANHPRELMLVHEGRSRRLAGDRFVEIPPLDEPGVYEVRLDETLLERFAVNFADRRESDLSELAPGVRLPKVSVSEPSTGFDNRHSWLVVAGIGCAMLVLLFDWIVLKT